MSRQTIRETAITLAIVAVLIVIFYTSLYWLSTSGRYEQSPPAPVAVRTDLTVVTEMCSVLPRTADAASRSVLAEWIVKSATTAPQLRPCLAQARVILEAS